MVVSGSPQQKQSPTLAALISAIGAALAKGRPQRFKFVAFVLNYELSADIACLIDGRIDCVGQRTQQDIVIV